MLFTIFLLKAGCGGSLISALRGQRLVDLCEFQVSEGYRVRFKKKVTLLGMVAVVYKTQHQGGRAKFKARLTQ